MKATINNYNLSSLSKGNVISAELSCWDNTNYNQALENKLHPILFDVQNGRYVPSKAGKKIGIEKTAATGQWKIKSIEATRMLLKKLGIDCIVKDIKYTTF